MGFISLVITAFVYACKYWILHLSLIHILKVEKVVIPLPEEDQICPVCGTQMVLIGEEYVRRELEFIPATVSYTHLLLSQRHHKCKNSARGTCREAACR